MEPNPRSPGSRRDGIEHYTRTSTHPHTSIHTSHPNRHDASLYIMHRAPSRSLTPRSRLYHTSLILSHYKDGFSDSTPVLRRALMSTFSVQGLRPTTTVPKVASPSVG